MRYNEGFVRVVDKAPPVFFRSWEPLKAKAGLLCVHGAGGNSGDFRKIAIELCKESYAIRAFDYPGSGFSPAADVPARDRLLLDLRILSAFASSQDTQALICSSSGAISVFSYLYGARKDPRTSRIPVIFSEPSFGYDEEMKRYMDACLGFLANSFANLDDALQAWDATPFAQIRFDSDEDKRDFVLGRLHPEGGALIPLASSLVDEKKKILANAKYFELLENKSTVQNPTFILWGSKGRLGDKHRLPAQSVFANLSMQTIENAGHPLSLTCREEIGAIKEYLGTLYG